MDKEEERSTSDGISSEMLTEIMEKSIRIFWNCQYLIQASPISIGGRQAFVEEKKTTSRGGAGGGRGRFPPGRGNFRNDSFRGRGNYGGRGYGRNDFGTRGDYSGRHHGYQRSDQKRAEVDVLVGLARQVWMAKLRCDR